MNDHLTDKRTGFGIRPYELQDIPALYAAACESITEIYPWLPWCHPNYRIEESESWVKYAIEQRVSGKGFECIIYALETGEFTGGVGIGNIDTNHRTANLGYWVRTGFTRRGAASSAARLAARYGIQVMGLLRLEIVASVENTASQRAAEKAGAVREGVLRNKMFIHGRSHDSVMFSFTPQDLSL